MWFADLKALLGTGIAAAEMQDENSCWSLMLINNSGYQLIGLKGRKIVEFFEEPLPIKSYEGEEIYAAIENAAQIALMSTTSSSLIILSETDLVSAEIVAGRLQFAGNTKFVEDNQFRKEPLMEMSLNILAEDQIKVSMHAIGNMFPPGAFPVEVNYIASNGKGPVQEAVIPIQLTADTVYELTPKKATTFIVALLVIVLGICGGAMALTGQQISAIQSKSSELDNQITQLDTSIKGFSTDKTDKAPEFDSIGEIEKVLKNNRTKIMAYAALGESIPQNLYLTYFMTADDGMINIKGCADSVEDVYVFFKNLKDSLVESKLRLSKLDLKNGSLDSVVNSTAITITIVLKFFFIIKKINNNL